MPFNISSKTLPVRQVLQYIIDATNASAFLEPAVQRFSTHQLADDNILDCIRRGHSDMPTELRVTEIPASLTGAALIQAREARRRARNALLKFYKECGEEPEEDSEEMSGDESGRDDQNFALTDDTAREVTVLLQNGLLELAFSW